MKQIWYKPCHFTGHYIAHKCSGAYLAKNLALSISDTYWICPVEAEISWESVSLHRAAARGSAELPYHNGTSYDPNASLGGQMSKYWDMSGSVPVLVKKAYENYGQQSINELFASELHSRQNTGVSYVSYYTKTAEDNAVISCCDAFTSEDIEFVSAYELLRSRKAENDRSEFDQIIDICEDNGMDRALMQRFMDYMVLSDFVISNTDEHLQNFGVLRDADNLKLLGPAPIFDSGNSMFFNITNTTGTEALNRKELLALKISSLHSSEEKMLAHVSDRTLISSELLPQPDEVGSFYSLHGIPESKSDIIAGSYANKLSLLGDYQKGITISLYRETHK